MSDRAKEIAGLLVGFVIVAGIFASFIFLIGCATLSQPRPGYTPPKACQEFLIDYTFRCTHRIMADSYTPCSQCFKKNSKVFPKAEDMVSGCYDETHDTYCVAAEMGCGDPACREAPWPPGFTKKRPHDAGQPKDLSTCD